jgi:hypothetical protein
MSPSDVNHFGICVICNNRNVIVDTRKICMKCVNFKPLPSNHLPSDLSPFDHLPIGFSSFDHLPIVLSRKDIKNPGFCVVCGDCNIITNIRKICKRCIKIRNNLMSSASYEKQSCTICIRRKSLSSSNLKYRDHHH